MIKGIDWRQTLLLVIFFSFFSIFFFVEPHAQNPHYHLFADGRFFLVPNFQNVLSNLIFIFCGFYAATKIQFNNHSRNEIIYICTFITGIFFTGFGSIFYHLNPNTNTLFWDRLPMSVGFVGFVSWLLSRTAFSQIDKNKKLDLFTYFILLALGLFSTLYWLYTEQIGRGDLRPYMSVQYGTILMALVIILIYPKNLYPMKSSAFLFVFYILAKITEKFDSIVFEVSMRLISGHTLKHLLAGVGCVLFFKYFYTKSNHNTIQMNDSKKQL